MSWVINYVFEFIKFDRLKKKKKLVNKYSGESRAHVDNHAKKLKLFLSFVITHPQLLSLFNAEYNNSMYNVSTKSQDAKSLHIHREQSNVFEFNFVYYIILLIIILRSFRPFRDCPSHCC